MFYQGTQILVQNSRYFNRKCLHALIATAKISENCFRQTNTQDPKSFTFPYQLRRDGNYIYKQNQKKKLKMKKK